MTRKDNDLITYWNEGFRKIRASGEYTMLCNQAIKEHGMLAIENIVFKNIKK